MQTKTKSKLNNPRISDTIQAAMEEWKFIVQEIKVGYECLGGRLWNLLDE